MRTLAHVGRTTIGRRRPHIFGGSGRPVIGSAVMSREMRLSREQRAAAVAKAARALAAVADEYGPQGQPTFEGAHPGLW